MRSLTWDCGPEGVRLDRVLSDPGVVRLVVSVQAVRPNQRTSAWSGSESRLDALDRVRFEGHRDSVSNQPVDVLAGEPRDTRRGQGSQITTASRHVAGCPDRRCCAILSAVRRLVGGVTQSRHCFSPALRYVRRE